MPIDWDEYRDAPRLRVTRRLPTLYVVRISRWDYLKLTVRRLAWWR